MSRVAWMLLVNVALFGGEAVMWAVAGSVAAVAYGTGLLVGLLLVLAFVWAERAQVRS